MSVSAVSSVSSSTATTQTVYPILVNGYLCFSAAAVQKARQFVNPYPTVRTSSASSGSAATVSTSSTSASASSSVSGYTASGGSQAAQVRGTVLNLVA